MLKNHLGTSSFCRLHAQVACAVPSKMIYAHQHSFAARSSDCDVPCNTPHQKLQTYRSYYLSIHRFVDLIKACTAAKDLERGCALHADLARLSLLERNVFVRSTLVDMYAKCGSVRKAQEVFDSLVFRDVVSWTALIAGYSAQGPYELAFDCVERMQHEGISPNSFTVVCLLKASCHLGAINKGEEIHMETALKGLEKEEFIGNSLVDMYVKCGYLVEAYAVFCQLDVRSVVSWTVLIGGYVDCGLSEEALNCYKQMQHSYSSPNIAAFVCTLKACGSIIAIDTGQEVHTEIVLRGLEDDICIGNTLMDMYFKCGLLANAEATFQKLPFQDTISWNILLAGYSVYCSGEEAFVTFEEMQLEGFFVDEATCVCLLRACSNLGNTQKGMKLHVMIMKTGMDQRLSVANTMVDMYGKLGLVMEAQHVFDNLLVRNLVSWNALIAGHTEHACAEEVLRFSKEMQNDGFSPDAITYVCSLKACASIGSIQKGEEMHLEIVKLGMEGELPIGNTLMHMYAKCGSPAEAQEIFDKLSVRTVVSWTALMVGWAQFGRTGIVLSLFDKMIEERVTPNSVTLTCVLNACSDEGLVFIHQSYLRSISNHSGIIPTLEHYACIIDLLGRAGLLDKAIRTTEEMPMSPNIVIWLSVLGACRNWGNVELGKVAFENALHLDRTSLAAYLCMYNIFLEAGMYDEAYAVELRRAASRHEKQKITWKCKTECH